MRAKVTRPTPAAARERRRRVTRVIVAAAKLELDRQKMLLENDREKDKIARDAVLKERELELKHKADIKDAELRAQVQADRQAQAKQE